MRRIVATAVAIALAATGSAAFAQGFAVNEHGTCAMSRGGTGVAKPCADGSAMFFNPAGLVAHPGFTLSVGVVDIAAHGNFTADSTHAVTALNNSPIPVPHVYAAYAHGSFAAGVGLFAPYGLGTRWPITFEGRFLGYDNLLRTIYLQPTVAWKPAKKLSVGAGFDVSFGYVKLTQRVDLSTTPLPVSTVPPGTTFGNIGIPYETDFATAVLEGNGTGVAGHVGVIFQPTDRLSIGARYLTRSHINYSGNVKFTAVATGLKLPAGNPLGLPAGTPLDIALVPAFQKGGPLANQTVSTEITMPDQLVAGVAFDVSPALTLLADYQFMHWATFDTLPINFADSTLNRKQVEDFRNTNAIRVGFDWAATEHVSIRGGYLHHTAAEPNYSVTPLLPEGMRNEFVAGLGIRLTRNLSADVAYQYIRQQNRRGRVQDTAVNTGLYSFTANLFAATLTAHF